MSLSNTTSPKSLHGSKPLKRHVLKQKKVLKNSASPSTALPKSQGVEPCAPQENSTIQTSSNAQNFDSVASGIKSKLEQEKRGRGRPRKDAASAAVTPTGLPAGGTATIPGSMSATTAIQPAEPMVDAATIKFLVASRFEATGLKHWNYPDKKCEALAFHVNRIANHILPMFANSPHAVAWTSAGAILMMVGPDIVADIQAHKKAKEANALAEKSKTA